MPKKIYFESTVHHFLMAARRIADGEKNKSSENYNAWTRFIDSLTFEYPSPEMRVVWTYPQKGEASLIVTGEAFYFRGDKLEFIEKQKSRGMLFEKDSLEEKNASFFYGQVLQISRKAGLSVMSPKENADFGRLHKEEKFHDEWAEGTDARLIPVRQINEACTAPEMRYIRKVLGDLKGKKLLDLGCGLGEASVYFAMEGAEVTSADLSKGMLECTAELASLHGVKVKTHQSAAEDLRLAETEKFDVIYAGNVFHHVDIEQTVRRLKEHLKPDGTLISWDPVDYNPIINLYRVIATKVRTPDEHPLTLSDIQIFKRQFKKVETKWFWLTTLIIFILMVLVQGKHPNKERFWKKVIEDSERWKWLYDPLEKFDEFLLKVFPFLKPLCWNVVIVASSPSQEDVALR